MYKIKEMGSKYAVMDDNDEVAGLFNKKALATKVMTDFNKSVKKPKNKKKAKKK
tara:strand:- start:688 stop:849 length:162 start_codon:yes stop_codon:yes gene_type:complete